MDDDSFHDQEGEPPVTEPVWVTTTLWLTPNSRYATAATAGAAFGSLMCFFYASTEHSPVGWAFCGVFAVLAGLIGAASVSRHLHGRRLGAFDSPGDSNSEGRPTVPILVLLISTYSWMLTIGLHLFRRFFAANGPGGLKYNVTLGIALASSVYMTFHGRFVIRRYFGTAGARNENLSPVEALVVIAFVLGAGVYLAWIMD
jgi:hypothetical protein